jgi:hypothetical protein
MSIHAAGSLPRQQFLTVFLLSLGVLMLQIALGRIFSFTIWYHFAYISVSLALLGFGASGSMLFAFPRLAGASIGRTMGLYCACCAVATVAALLVVGGVPLSPFEVLRSPTELAKLVLYFGVVTLPFFFAGLAITVALRAAGPDVDRLYCWDLVGAGLGCALAVFCIDGLETPRVVMLVAIVFAGAGVVASVDARGARMLNLAVGVVLLALLVPAPMRLPFTPSRDKDIYTSLLWNLDIFTRWTAIFRTDVLAIGDVDPKGGYREVGTSRSYQGPAPRFRMIVHDGGAGAIMYRTAEGLDDVQMFRHHVLATPYVVRQRPEVLVIGVGGGADVVNGLVNGAANVTGAELDPVTIELITKTYGDYTGIYDRPDVGIHASEGRHFTRSTNRRFDMVQITGVDTLAALSSGAYILSENYLYTVEAYEDYFRVLRDDGIHSIGTMDFHPRLGLPRHALRFAALSFDALRARGAERPADHVIVIGTSDTASMLEIVTKLQPFSDDEIAAVERFADANGFEAWYLPRRPDRQLPMFRTVLEGSAPERQRFFTDTFLDLRPTTDDRPFFFSYYKWRHLFERRDDIDRGHTLATGQIVLVLILALSILFSIAAIGLPLWSARRGAGAMPGSFGFLAYFAALGAGFIFVEVSFVQIFIRFLGYPTYSLTVMLFAFLTAAGLGALASGRLPDDPRRVLPPLVGVLTALVVLYAVVLPSIFDRWLAAPLAVRVALTALLCAPLGAVLGTFFPYGIRLISARDRDFVAWAWAVNGCLTVVGSVTSIILAMTFGFSTVLALALAIYWLGAASFVATHRRVTQGA